MTHEQRLDFEDGKYTLILAENGYTVTALRYGEPWRDFVGDSFISYLAQAVFEKAQAPTDDERDALTRAIDGQYFCPVEEGGTYGSHIELDVHEARVIADTVLAAGFRRPAQTEPTAILFSARRSGKSQALIDSMLAQANERGIRVEVAYPQSEPTDAQIEAGATSLDTHRWKTMGVNTVECECGEVLGDLVEDAALRTFPADEVFRAHLAHSVLKAAFTAGQEEQS